ncbi:hypothetical protein H1R17_09145 [Flavobacterium sp. xlx-214]|uniref:hypothetical protein n=1 Tax=unclassified Flavobacterium TaxID=196869 RepID=UPI0013D33AA8|nr:MULTISPECIES: hypothetical protein [unclassified Flavobacterium]MBA5793997.1 hypothetical protein [Flavobacterium sp. xlx-221]QMI82634.1 hypothetical protein H1R17_09145 [Flavobacterium sp. xlx-214]
MKKNVTTKIALFALTAALMTSCQDDINEPKVDDQTPTPETPQPAIELKNHSNIPALVYGMPGFDKLEIFTLISSSDKLEQSPNFVFGAQPDGSGIMRNPNGDGYIMITNHEILQSVSRVYLDKNFKPIKGEYIVDGIGGMTRLCSATLVEPKVHGFGPVFLTAGESGEESMVHAIDPMGFVNDRSRTDRVKPALGKASMENAVPLPADVSGNGTYILIGEDQGYSTSHQSAGQLIMYYSPNRGDLENGKLYALKRKDNTLTEGSMTKNNTYDVEFVEIPNAKNLTGAEINAANIANKALRFSRVEDVDYRKGKGNGNEIYFTATGQASGGAPVDGYTMWGRVYKLALDKNNMFTGKLEIIAEGDSNPGNDLINPDNLCVTENYVYIQEDGDSYYAGANHDSYIWQYSMATKSYKPWLNMKHNRGNTEWSQMFDQSGNLNKFGSWEYGAMVDVSDLVGIPGTFAVNIHPHTWQKPEFANADGSGTQTNKEGGQIVLIKNVQR